LESESARCANVRQWREYRREGDKPQACHSFTGVAIVDADNAMAGIAEDMCGALATDCGSGGRYGLGG